MNESSVKTSVQTRGSPFKSGASPTAMHNTLSLSHRADKAVTKQLIGSRLIEARNINGLSQSEGAVRLGYQTSAQLSQWEQAKRMPPLTALVHACRMYRVSMDFVVGLSDDPDRDPVSAERQKILQDASTSLESMAQRLTDAVIYQTNLGGPTLQATYLMKRDMARVLEAFDKFLKLNPEFEDMRGGATLQSAMGDLGKALASAQEIVQRHRRINDAATTGVIKQVRPHDNHPLFEQAANDD